MKNTLQQIILSLVAAILLTACSSGGTGDPSADGSVIPTEATFSAIIDGDVEVTLPISQLGLTETDITWSSMMVYRNDVLWDFDLDASVLYNTDRQSFYFVLIQMEVGDDIRVVLNASDGRRITYNGFMNETEDSVATVSSADALVEEGDGADTGDGEIGETYTTNANGADTLYINVSPIDENGTATITIPMDVFEHSKFVSEYDSSEIYYYSGVNIMPVSTESGGYNERVSDVYDGVSASLTIPITNLQDGDVLEVGLFFYDTFGWSENITVSTTNELNLLMDYYIQDRTPLD